MELREFVKSTLLEIVHGVKDAQNEVDRVGARINAVPGQGKDLTITLDGRLLKDIEFDVAVTTETEKGGGAKIKVWGIGGGIEGSSKDSIVSRIRFSIPLALPKPTSG